MYSSPLIYINLDKHQSHEIQWTPRDSLELDRSLAIIGSFGPEVPFYDLDTVFKRVFGYDLSCMVLERTALGTFSKLPDELIWHVAQIGDLQDALILSTTNGYWFTILYATIVEKIRRVDAADRWNSDRLICVGIAEKTLPDNYLTEDERNEIVAWWYHYEWKDNPEIPPSKSTIEATLTEIEPDAYSAICKALGDVLYEYGCIMDHPQISETDNHRLIALELSVVSRRGDWAGDRMALVLCSELEEKMKCEEGWKEKVLQWSSDE